MSRVDYRHGTSPEALADLPDGCAMAVVTDPPYGTQTDSSIYGRRGAWAGGGRIANDCDLSQLVAVAPSLVRLLAPMGVAFLCCAPQRRREAENIIEAAGLEPLHVVSWDKGSPGISYRLRYAHEDIILAALPGVDPWEAREPLISPIRAAKVLEPQHPHEKPIGLLRRLVAWACPTGGLVVDPFAGIASCGVAAVAEGCDYVGVECDPRWWEIAGRRLADVQNRPHHALQQHGLFTDGAA
jgi:DNA modification methylase